VASCKLCHKPLTVLLIKVTCQKFYYLSKHNEGIDFGHFLDYTYSVYSMSKFYFPMYSFHNKLKTNPKYLNVLHHVNRRCDDFNMTLLSFEEDMYHNCKYLEIISTPEILSEKHDGLDCHRRGKDISDDALRTITMKNSCFMAL